MVRNSGSRLGLSWPSSPAFFFSNQLAHFIGAVRRQFDVPSRGERNAARNDEFVAQSLHDRLWAREAIAQFGSDAPDTRLVDGENAFIWIVDWPLLLETSPDVYTPPRHVFGFPQTPPLRLRTKQDLLTTSMYSYDLVLNGMEVGGGNLRVSRAGDLVHMIKLMGLPVEQYRSLIEMLERSGKRHGGFAFGFDRLVMALTGASDINSIIAFPDSLIVG